MIYGERALIVARREVARDHVCLRLKAPRIASSAAPGQFVNVRCGGADFTSRAFEDEHALRMHRTQGGAGDTLLLRPFAVHRRWVSGENEGEIELLFKVVGRGTRRLGGMKPGESVTVLGPLGRGFDLDWCSKLSSAAVVAGGVGVAPLYPLVAYLREHHVRTLVLVGAMSEADIPLETADSRVALSFAEERPEVTITAREFEELGCEVGIVTMQGRKGYIGLPTDMFDRWLHRTEGGARGEAGVFTCGPDAMMRIVATHAEEHGVRCQVLLEERMGCGIGVCMACSCRVRDAGGAIVRKRVCMDGPVFDASEVIWDDA